MKILIDMNLSPEWTALSVASGWQATHWSAVGDPRTKDSEVMKWARSNDYVLFTHDLDFGALLALTGAHGPSVIQVRAQNILPHHLGAMVVQVLREYGEI